MRDSKSQAREKEGDSIGDALLQREGQWILRASSIADAFCKIRKSEEKIEKRIENIETPIKTGKQTGNAVNSMIEITPF